MRDDVPKTRSVHRAAFRMPRQLMVNSPILFFVSFLLLPIWRVRVADCETPGNPIRFQSIHADDSMLPLIPNIYCVYLPISNGTWFQEGCDIKMCLVMALIVDPFLREGWRCENLQLMLNLAMENEACTSVVHIKSILPCILLRNHSHLCITVIEFS
jgi:hypothetical protein